MRGAGAARVHLGGIGIRLPTEDSEGSERGGGSRAAWAHNSLIAGASVMWPACYLGRR